MPDTTPDLDARTDKDRLCAAVDALLGDDNCEKLVEWLKNFLAAKIANPDFYDPPTTAVACTAVTFFVQTNRPDLHYDVLLYQLPDTTNPIFSYMNVQGAPMFGVEFPAYDVNGNCLFQSGYSYRVVVQVDPPWLGNTDMTDLIATDSVPIYSSDGDGEAMKAAANGSARKHAAVAVKPAIPKPAPKLPGKSKK